MEPAAIIGLLNDLFDGQVPAIERWGGEVLKFIGDGLLAVFPIQEGRRGARDRCDAALAAATDVFEALARASAVRRARGDVPIRIGLALHLGDIAYGNIGGASRLDFTCIGSAVNIASRLMGLTEGLGRSVVVSDEVARLTSRPVELLGSFDLKGVAEAQRVWAPVETRAPDSAASHGAPQ